MKPIKLHTPIHTQDSETVTEYDAEGITHITSVVGDDSREGTHFYSLGSPERQFCIEPAKQVREMVEEAKRAEEVELSGEATTLLALGAKSADGKIHFIEGDVASLRIEVGDYRLGPFTGRFRSKYEHARDQLQSYYFVVRKNGGYQITERGYVMGEFLVENHFDDKPFRGYRQLPAAITQATEVDTSMTECKTKKVFVVHGHDEEMKQATARVLGLLGLEPIILHEQANEGKTIIEKFEKHADVGFAVILLSPDDMAYPANDASKTARPRARQNVILELGYFTAKLGRARVFPLYRGGSDLELPSDIAGVIYVKYDSDGGWRFQLARELKVCGYHVDANKLM